MSSSSAVRVFLVYGCTLWFSLLLVDASDNNFTFVQTLRLSTCCPIYFGTSVSLNANGDTLLVGFSGPQAPNGVRGNEGFAMFKRNEVGVWNQDGPKLRGSGSIGDSWQGSSTALSDDGNTALVGGPVDDTWRGSVWVFVRSNGAWQEQTRLYWPGSATKTRFGQRVALSGDGNTALIGSYNYNTDLSTDGNRDGMAWFFTRQNGVWDAGTAFTDRNGFGYSVTMNGNGDLAAIGSYGDNSLVGCVHIFTRAAGSWTKTQKLIASQSVSPMMVGTILKMSYDGSTLIVLPDSYYTDTYGSGLLLFWIFVRDPNTHAWTEQKRQVITTSPSRSGDFVDLSADGNLAIVGAPFENSNQGQVYVYQRDPETALWSNNPLILRRFDLPASACQGWAVAMSADKSTLAIGASNLNTFSDDGRVAIYAFEGSPLTSAPSTSRPSVSPLLSSPSPSLSPTTSRPSVSPTVSSPSLSPTTSRPSVSPSLSSPSLSPTTSRPSVADWPTSSPSAIPQLSAGALTAGAVAGSVTGACAALVILFLIVFLNHRRNKMASTSNSPRDEELATAATRSPERKQVAIVERIGHWDETGEESSRNIPVAQVIHVDDMTVEEVATSLRQEGLERYSNLFGKERIDGATLSLLDDDAIEELGVQSSLDRKRILAMIRRLKQQEQNDYGDSDLL